MTRGIIPQVAKRITFDLKIIETLYTSLRQITAIVWRSSKEWHTRTRMDDVNYLVEDKARDDFAYHRKWMGPMVGWNNDGASWEQKCKC